MRKPRPTPDATFLFHPEFDDAYVHFDGHEHAPFAPPATSMTRANAWWLAESALLSYWDPAEAISRFQTAGLTAEFVRDGDTQAYVASNAQVVLISFRGTEAGSLGDIVSDALVPLVPWTHGTVHLGFKAALERVWPAIVSTLEPLASSRSVWFSGHSLGGGAGNSGRRPVSVDVGRVHDWLTASRRSPVRRSLRCALRPSRAAIHQRHRYRHSRA